MDVDDRIMYNDTLWLWFYWMHNNYYSGNDKWLNRVGQAGLNGKIENKYKNIKEINKNNK
jgi:hypothetical protein